MSPRLSILIPSIPSRFDRAIKLYKEIEQKTSGMDVEILMFTDNKRRTIGEKRDDLKNISNGKYFMFVDDDDSIYNVEKLYEATEQDVDVITFKQRCRNKDGSHYIVTFGLGNEIEHNAVNGNYIDLKRPPFHVCAWNQKFKEFHFAAINYGEDWEFIKQVLPIAKTEIFIDDIVHSYNFDENITEADASSNKFWTNPNDYGKD